ncbi:hypothetical protein Tco_0729403 [Tanacetum coccineum]|uniref:Uncharacterized protein n=1 Tax=Tanacetum coccineum TaxID=301880 RepID=A0ABQ4YRI3_9ASTR
MISMMLRLVFLPRRDVTDCSAWGLPLQNDVRDTINQEQGLGVTAKDGTITKFLGKFPEYKQTKEEEEISKLKAICENVTYDISDIDSDLESTGRSGPRDSEMEDTGGSGIRINA